MLVCMSDRRVGRRNLLTSMVGLSSYGFFGNTVSSARTDRSTTEKQLRKLTQTHGSPQIAKLSSMQDGEKIVYDNSHAEYIDLLDSRGFGTIQVETLKFDDGYTANLITGQEGGEGVEMIDDSGNRLSKATRTSNVKSLDKDRVKVTEDMLKRTEHEHEEMMSEVNSSGGRSTSAESSSHSVRKSLEPTTSHSIGKGDSGNFIDARYGNHDTWGQFPFTSPAAAMDNPSKERVGVTVTTRVLAYKAGGSGEVYQKVKFEDDGLVRFSFFGTIRGVISAAIASASVSCTAFVRENYGGNEKKMDLMELSDALEARGINKYYGPDDPGPGGDKGPLYYRVEEGNTYEMGVKLKILSTAFGTSSAVANFYPKYQWYDSKGYLDYNNISVQYV